MDEDGINKRGLRPVRPLIDAVAALRDVRDLAAFLGEFERVGGHGLFGAYVNTDDRNSDRYLFHIVQGGLGLPDESYYRDDKFAEIRDKYVAYLTELFTLADHEDPAARRRDGAAIDTRLAAGPLGARRDPRRPEDLQPDDRRRAEGALPGLRLGRLRHQPRRLRRDDRGDLRPAAVVPRAPLDRCSTRSRSRTGGPGCSSTCCAPRRRTSPTTSSRPTSTSTAAPSTAPPSCGRAGSAASPWSRARSARPSASSTSPATSRPRRRRRWTPWSPTCSRPTAARSPTSTG